MSKASSRREKKEKFKFRVEFPDYTGEQVETAADNTYLLPDVGEEAIINYDGKEVPINVNMLNDIRKLGFGNYGSVMLAEVQNHPEIKMAVKRLGLMPSTNNLADYTATTDLKTIRAVGSCNSPHVIKFYAGLIDRKENQVVICMEACDTSMEKFHITMHKIKETKHIDILLKRMINHIVDALQFLKSKGILHRDVKPSNILIKQNPVIFKICDFGISGQLTNSVAHTMMKGTQVYLAPERIDASQAPEGYGIRSDMWALGLSTLEIATGQHPFAKMNALGIMSAMMTWVPEVPTNLSTELQQLVVWLLRIRQADRPTTYDEIQVSPAIRSLPAEITDGETEMVKNVIANIPVIPDDY
jgi:mitogen-activated protein kinase kinase 3